MRRSWLIAGTIVLAVLIIMAGIRFVAYPLFVANPDAVHIVVKRIDTTGSTIIFDQRFTQPAKEIYSQMVAGGQGHAECPSYATTQAYYHYDMTFTHMGIVVTDAASDARGCAVIGATYPDGSHIYYAWGTLNDVSFWLRLHRLVNAPLPINMCFSQLSC